jgi:ribonuclease BN (tRNA processing enzyme)
MAKRTLTVLGCDGSYAGPGGACSGYLVQAGSTTLWLDAGPGSFANLQLVCDPGVIDAVLLSHEHPDHWTDLESFAVWRRQHASGVVPVYAPPGLRGRSYFGDDQSLGWREVGPAYQVSIGDLTCSFVATDHGPPTLAVRLDPAVPGRVGADLSASLAYSADTGPDWSVEELGRGIGTVLCEATYTRDREGEGRHLSGRQAGAMAVDADVARLVVTHRWPTVSAEALADEAGTGFGRLVDQASAGSVFAW